MGQTKIKVQNGSSEKYSEYLEKCITVLQSETAQKQLIFHAIDS